MQFSRRENNFDLIRLFAALQVMLFHCYEHLQVPSPVFNNVVHALRFFPGVPIFFTISGFLVFASYDNSKSLKNYIRNRFLRIYPGLWGSLLFTIIVVACFGDLAITAFIFSKDFFIWLATQVTFLQFFTPRIFYDAGYSNPNGSLWTIPVELSFYVVVPFVFLLFRRFNKNATLVLLIALSIAYNIFYHHYKVQPNRSDFVKLMGLNLAPFLFYFLFGAIAYVNWNRLKKWYEHKGLIWLSGYIIYCLVFSVWLGKFDVSYWVGPYDLIAMVLLSQATIAMAFSYSHTISGLLHKNDLSYGIYLYHMPVINTLLVTGMGGHISVVLIAVIATIVMAALSWRFLERPALLHKKRALVQV